jgi:hypothetical protein
MPAPRALSPVWARDGRAPAGCKIPQSDLLKLLEGLSDHIGMDCAVVPSKKYPGEALRSSRPCWFAAAD